MVNFKPTIGGIPLECFARQPAPDELGFFVAQMDHRDLADFFGTLGETLKDYNSNLHVKIHAIAETIETREEELCDGSGSHFIAELAKALALAAEANAEAA